MEKQVRRCGQALASLRRCIKQQTEAVGTLEGMAQALTHKEEVARLRVGALLNQMRMLCGNVLASYQVTQRLSSPSSFTCRFLADKLSTPVHIAHNAGFAGCC
jgi:hypothetical protein